ncbi:hypothetical protein VP01_8185g1 [Puccinia sorghi]|uniref:DDE Tnp4 domain-containing protein n=1 Tax=Puccinia sorghi TaxID=27349 RepID=A0A0L6UC73_9BASI|nr:hypothetical protein VP01_8185g1 [Puccinia sorghi]
MGKEKLYVTALSSNTIKWIISCGVLHNLLANLKDQWNELYEEDEPDSSLAEDKIDK